VERSNGRPPACAATRADQIEPMTATPVSWPSPGPLCMDCADLGHLVFLPAGNAALSRRAKQASRLSAVVVRFSRTRKRYECQGILVEEAALEQAEAQCLADEDARSRRRERDRQRRADQDVMFQARLAEAVGRLFPACPAARAVAIAQHAAVRGSGRVGRSAAGCALDEAVVTLAVVASVRHQDTDYDELLMAGVPRASPASRSGPLWTECWHLAAPIGLELRDGLGVADAW
jgi:hypothetical protein